MTGTNPSRAWLKLGLVILVLATTIHVLAVWAIPRIITGMFIRRVSTQAGVNTVILPPLPTDKSRGVVKPSPDLLYALCVFDVSAGPARITAQPPGGYWSLALYDRNSDNFFNLNDRDAKGGAVELILAMAGADTGLKAKYPSAVIVRPTSSSGVLLARSLVLDPASMQDIVAARSQTRCEAIKE